MMIIIPILIVIGAYYIYKNNDGKLFERNDTSKAEETLKIRYINGEIDDATYLKMMSLIKK
ncbi:MAG TPA: hypothetical protein DCG34_08620 [Clostridiales bacterium]|jgi:uncharacterized membrane protein|nr:hypothetical protein [Clostridiales bacterium]